MNECGCELILDGKSAFIRTSLSQKHKIFWFEGGKLHKQPVQFCLSFTCRARSTHEGATDKLL